MMTDPSTKMVLVVEDMDDIAGFVKTALEEMGLQAFTANNPEKAIAFLEQYQPDLIMLDIGLPGMTGWQLLDIINEWRKAEKIRIVVATAYTDPANRLIGKLQQVDAYLFKPYDFSELRRTIYGLLDMKAD